MGGACRALRAPHLHWGHPPRSATLCDGGQARAWLVLHTWVQPGALVVCHQVAGLVVVVGWQLAGSLAGSVVLCSAV